MKPPIRPVDSLVLLFVLVAFALLFGRLVSDQHFSWDESDYVYAASKGFVASYLDRPSISIVDFVKTGVRDGLRSGEWRKLSEYIRQKDDINLYRHFHPPLYFYGLDFIRTLTGQKESILRWASLLSLMLVACVVYFGCLATAGRHGRFVALLAVGFLLLSPTSVEVARWVAPHSLYVACAMATLFFLTKLIQTKELRFLYGALVCLGFAFLSIEYAPLLLIVLLVTVYADRAALFPNWPRKDLFRFLLTCAAIPLLTIAALWPAGVFKLSLLKNYGFFIYYVVVRGQEYGMAPLSTVWWTRITSSPFEYLLLLSLSSYFVYLLFRRRDLRYLLPFLLYASLIFLTTVRNRSESGNYVSSFLPPLAVISAFTISWLLEAQPRLRGAAAALILSLAAANNFWFYYRVEASKPPDQGLAGIVDTLRESGVQGERLLVPQNYKATIHYYFQGASLIGYTGNDGKRALLDSLGHGSFDGVVYQGSDYEAVRDLLAKNWSISSSIRVASDKPEKSVAYYRLLSTRSDLSHVSFEADRTSAP